MTFNHFFVIFTKKYYHYKMIIAIKTISFFSDTLTKKCYSYFVDARKEVFILGINLNKITDFFGLADDDMYEAVQSPNSKEIETFGKLLKEIRQASAMTSSSLAEKAKISQSYISQLENNIRLPSDKIISKIAYALIERRNSHADVTNLKFSSKENMKKFNGLVNELISARDYMRIRDIPTLIGTDIEDNPIRIDQTEKDFLGLFAKIDPADRDTLKTYMEFLINKKK